jgi:hypothetical protein
MQQHRHADEQKTAQQITVDEGHGTLFLGERQAFRSRRVHQGSLGFHPSLLL